MYIPQFLYLCNQNHKKVSPHTYYNGFYQRDKFRQDCGETGALGKLWTENGVATMETSIGVLQKTNKNWNQDFEEILLHSSTLFRVAKRWKQPKNLFYGQKFIRGLLYYGHLSNAWSHLSLDVMQCIFISYIEETTLVRISSLVNVLNVCSSGQIFT